MNTEKIEDWVRGHVPMVLILPCAFIATMGYYLMRGIAWLALPPDVWDKYFG